MQEGEIFEVYFLVLDSPEESLVRKSVPGSINGACVGRIL